MKAGRNQMTKFKHSKIRCNLAFKILSDMAEKELKMIGYSAKERK